MDTVTITMSREEAAAVLSLLSKKVVEPVEDDNDDNTEEPKKRRGRGKAKKEETTKQDVSEWAAPVETQKDEVSAPPPAAEPEIPDWMSASEPAPTPMTIQEAGAAITKLVQGANGDANAIAAIQAKFQELVKKYGKSGGRGLSGVPADKLADLVAEMGA